MFVPNEDMFNVSDHKPITCTVKLTYRSTIRDNAVDQIHGSDKVSWTKALGQNSIEDYSFAISQYLWSVRAPSSPTPAEDIDFYYIYKGTTI